LIKRLRGTVRQLKETHKPTRFFIRLTLHSSTIMATTTLCGHTDNSAYMTSNLSNARVSVCVCVCVYFSSCSRTREYG